MNTKRTFFYTMLAAGLLASCTNDELADNPLADGPVAAQVTADISQTLTRVSANANGISASFTNGDIINVVADGSATYVYTLQDNGTTWSAGNNPYYFQNRDIVSFQAWYAAPGYKKTSNAIEINTKNQTVSSGWNQWDILATPVVKTDVISPTVDFTGTNAFSHVMTQVTMVFKKGDGISDLAALEGYTLKSLTTDATFNTLNCTLTPRTTTGDITVTDISASGTEYTCTPLILVPQTVTGTIALEVAYNSQTYKAELNAPTAGLQAGYSYTYTVTVSNTKLEVSNAAISDWRTDRDFNGNGNATLR